MARPYMDLAVRLDPERRRRAEERARYDLEQRCQHWDEAGPDALGLMQYEQCPREGRQVRLRCPAGRPDAISAYCDEHGGEARAQVEAERDWMYAAPEAVGGPAEVEDAGCQQLQTPDAYVVLRQTPAAQGGRWLAWRGLGSMMIPVENPQPQVRLRANGKPRRRGGSAYSGRNGALAFPSRETALAEALIRWRAGLDTRVEAIRRLRGGTLAWGTPVEPLESPVVILLGQGDSRSAWDIAVTLPRRSRGGVSGLTGLRPSGECA